MSQQKQPKGPDVSELFPDDVEAPNSNATRMEFLHRSRSGFTKIRHSFVQKPPTRKHGGSKPAMLPTFARNHRAAVLYLAVLTNWPWLSRSDETLSAKTWIRFLSSNKPGALTWTEQSLAHAWKQLEQGDLVVRDLDHRMKKVRPLDESGSSDPYVRPQGSRDGVYFALPHEFWSRELHATLSWPALAVLLILLKETNGRPTAELPVDRAQRYYGISRTTAEQGLTELRAEGLLTSRTRFILDHDTADGRRQTSLHALLDPFSTSHREQLRNAARERRKASKPKKQKTKTKARPREVVDDEQSEGKA